MTRALPLARLAIALLSAGTVAAPTSAQDLADAAAGPSILGLLEVAGRTATPGAELLGELRAGDFLVPAGHRVQAWSFRGSEGDGLRIDLGSTDFDPYLYLVGPGLATPLTDDDGGMGLNSRICTRLPGSGEFRVVVASLGGEAGRYSLRVTPGATAADDCEAEGTGGEISDLASLPTEGRLLEVGGSSAGSLPSFAPTYFGAPVQGWALEGRGGEALTVELRSGAFDAYLMLTGPGIAEPLTDDDGAGGCDSRLTFTPTAAGTYGVIVSSLGSGTGPFTLEARRGDGGPRRTESCVPPSTPAERTAEDGPEALPLRGRLEAEGSVSGELASTDPVWLGAPVHAWGLTARAGDRIRIDHSSDDFDAYLGFVGPGFDPPVRDDDSGDGLDSQLCVEIPGDGEYRVLASALSGGSTGRYTLEVSRSRGDTCAAVTLSSGQRETRLAEVAPAGALTRDTEYVGSLDDGDPRHPDRGGPMEVWTFEARSGDRLAADVFSRDFDTYLSVSGPGLEEALTDDDGGGCTDSRLWITFPSSGTYRVIATSYAESGRGEYRVVVTATPDEARPCGVTSSGDAGASDLSAAVVAENRRIPRPPAAQLPVPSRGSPPGANSMNVAGLEIEGTLGTSDPLMEGTRRVQAWSLEAQAGDRYFVELASSDFDAYLFVDGPGLETLSDDDSGEGLDARVELVAPETGSYRIVVTTVASGGTGDFTLRLLRWP